MNGLAVAILLASIAMAAAPAALGAWLGYRAGPVGAVIGGVIGFAAGAVGVIATFMESTWSPPPRIVFEVPADFTHEWIFIIPDNAATQELVWTGRDMPFSSRSTKLVVPKNGVVRIKDLGSLDGDNVEATLSNGKKEWGKGGINAPPGIGTGRLVMYSFAQYPGTEPDPGMMDLPTLGALIAAREAEGKDPPPTPPQ